MKLYYAYKKQFSILFLGILLIIVPIFFSYAQSVEELKKQIDSHNSIIADLENKNKEIQRQLDDLSKQKNSLNTALKQLDLTKKKLMSDISITENKIQKKDLEIKELSFQIGTKEDSISRNLNAINLEIRNINEIEQDSIIEKILSSDKISNTWNDIDNMATVRDSIRAHIVELNAVKGQLEDTRQITTDAKQELVSLKSELADQKKIVDQNTKEKKKLLTQTKNSEALYQKNLKANNAKKDTFEKEVEEYESQLKFILDPSSLPGKGVLSWPLDNIHITQLFGVTKDSKRLYASGSHSGVDFRAAVGTPVKAVADGIVIGTGNTDITCPYTSFGKFIFIKHNNGLSTTYGHLSLIKVNEGQKVKRGDIIGYSGNTGHTTGPHLHLTVYASEAAEMIIRPSTTCPGKTYRMPIAPTNAYLDPMYYLPKL